MILGCKIFQMSLLIADYFINSNVEHKYFFVPNLSSGYKMCHCWCGLHDPWVLMLCGLWECEKERRKHRILSQGGKATKRILGARRLVTQ